MLNKYGPDKKESKGDKTSLLSVLHSLLIGLTHSLLEILPKNAFGS